VFTSDERCTLAKDRESISYGQPNAIDSPFIPNEYDFSRISRIWTETKAIKTPPNSLNMGDWDADNYWALLVNQLNVDSDGFPLNY